MGSTQMYSLSWGEFGSSLASTVQVLRGHEELVDVTLAAGGRIFPAHKLVLSAASPLLMELLKSTGCQHPVVMLAGVTAHDLEALLQFVYYGEVSVDPNQLPSLLQAAHCLDIQALSPTASLASEKMMSQSMTVGTDGLTQNDSSLLPVRKRKRKQRRAPENGLPNKWPLMESIGTDNMENMPSTAGPLTDCKEESSSCADDNSLPTKKLVSDQPVECVICGVVLKQSRNLRRHMALIHMKVSEGRPRKTKKQMEKIKKENSIGITHETENGISSNGLALLRSIPSSALSYGGVGFLPGPLYQQNESHRSPPLPLAATRPQELSQSSEVQNISEPDTATSLCETMSSSAFVPTTMSHAMQFASDSLFRHQNDLMRNASLYNITDTSEHCAND